MSERFYTKDPLGPGEYLLTGPEAHHLATVRRFQPGDRVVLFNGNGYEYPSEVLATAKKSITLNVLAQVEANRELPFPLIVGCALPKGDRTDFLIEKLTELGATRFVPLLTVRSIVIPKASAVEKFTRTVIEASKQCGRNRLMAVDAPQPWHAFATRTDLPATRFVLHTAKQLAPLVPTCTGCAVAIGPEGGFTDNELALAQLHGWTAATLGPRVLRVETAAIAALALLANLSGHSGTERSMP